MPSLDQTQFFKVETEKPFSPADALNAVYMANLEKGYDPINQIVGYLVSDDPTYITSHNDARKLIRKFERDELLEELLKSYVEKNGLPLKLDK